MYSLLIVSWILLYIHIQPIFKIDWDIYHCCPGQSGFYFITHFRHVSVYFFRIKILLMNFVLNFLCIREDSQCGLSLFVLNKDIFQLALTILFIIYYSRPQILKIIPNNPPTHPPQMTVPNTPNPPTSSTNTFLATTSMKNSNNSNKKQIQKMTSSSAA